MDTAQLNGHKRAVIYARVSSDEQANKGYSLPTQIEAGEKYARDCDFEIVGRFQDDFTGTSPIETRPEGRKAYAMLRNGQADVLIAYRIDRIVRPPEEGDPAHPALNERATRRRRVARKARRQRSR